MTFRVTKSGLPFAFEDGGERLERSDVYTMDVDRETEGRILQAMELIEFYGSEAAEWLYHGEAYKVEGIK